MKTFLTGFMCSGKSTVGRALATALGLPFVDLDRVVEARVGPLLPFIQRDGEDAFRERETEALMQMLEGSPAVVATGGGTPMQGDNLARMKAAGTVIWLDVPMAELMPRIERAGGDRPLLFGLRGEALHQRVADLLTERRDHYAQAHHAVDAGGTPEEVVERIRALLAGQPR